ncbi:MAG: methenyltetrahydromethanopterin cyclohydrolase [Rickettsiales bacterium]|nr:methenyltetrahydromethanopterin cyclohydrolase [Rickettsiales bacterium]|tara:strand:+ start:538 stop:1497 length:960 start_codon:yes stop_codon:yes gene_type:complete
MKSKFNFSVNKYSNQLVEDLIKHKEKFNLEVSRGPLNCNIIDAGINIAGSIKAGLKISEICLGGLGDVSIFPSPKINISSYTISVHSSKPVLACLGSQYAGWSLSHESFFSLGSGPVRSIVQKEKIFKELNYVDKSSKTSVVLEVDKFPPKEVVKKVSIDSNVKPENLTFIITPTTSICGNIQVVARVLEVAIHKIHELKFPLERVIHGIGYAPLPPLAKDFITGMGRTNDAIIYGGVVQLIIDGPEDDLIKLSKNLPSSSSSDYGKPFKEIFKHYNHDFYKIDGSLFSPALIIVNSKFSGKTYKGGKINEKLITKSFS